MCPMSVARLTSYLLNLKLTKLFHILRYAFLGLGLGVYIGWGSV